MICKLGIIAARLRQHTAEIVIKTNSCITFADHETGSCSRGGTSRELFIVHSIRNKAQTTSTQSIPTYNISPVILHTTGPNHCTKTPAQQIHMFLTLGAANENRI